MGSFRRKLSLLLAGLLARDGAISVEVAAAKPAPPSPEAKKLHHSSAIKNLPNDKSSGQRFRGRRTALNQVRGHKRGREGKRG